MKYISEEWYLLLVMKDKNKTKALIKKSTNI